ncbi:MAG: PadR family transcriptional regulator [Promethearchaeota archaeon]
MIKRVRELDSSVLMASEKFRNFVEKFESELIRGLSSLCILSIIRQAGEKGIHGYQILKELQQKTHEMLIIEEGTLYPLLKKLRDEGLIASIKEKGGRRRTFYYMTEPGFQIYNYLAGYYSKLIEAISWLFDIQVNLQKEKYFFCPMCANKIDLEEDDIRYCSVCGYNIEKDMKGGIKNE